MPVFGDAFEHFIILETVNAFTARNNIKSKTEIMPMEKVNNAIQKVRDYKARYRMVLKN